MFAQRRWFSNGIGPGRRLGFVAAATSVVAAAVMFGVSPAAYADSPEVFVYESSAPQQMTFVPDGVTAASVVLWGADGGTATGQGGGRGAKITGTVAVKPGQKLVVWVGARGGDAPKSTPGGGGQGAFGNAGNGGSVPETGAGAGGGGSTAILSGSTDSSDLIAVAGGGGGGGGTGLYPGVDNGGTGGDAGASPQPGEDASGDEGQGGGAGLPYTSPGTGVGGKGGAGNQSAGGGGGGGAGFRGGGGGEAGAKGLGTGGGGGGAGTSYAPALTSANITTETSPAANGSRAGDGRAEITWVKSNTGTTPINLTTDATTVVAGGPLSITATLPEDATGYVRFLDDTVSTEGTEGQLNTVTISGGKATLTKSINPMPMPEGKNSIRAVYLGDHKYTTVTSDPLEITVTAADDQKLEVLPGQTANDASPNITVAVSVGVLVLLVVAAGAATIVRRRTRR